jgi:uridylate kinase
VKPVVLSIGGSVVLSAQATPTYLRNLAQVLVTASQSTKMFVIVGGGTVAREYISRGRALGFDEDLLDTLGVDITRVNARIFTNMLPDANREIPHTTDEALALHHPIVVMGGTTPKHSTDMVGAELAEKSQARCFINATNVDGIFDKDPKKHPDAQQLKEVHIDELIKTYGTTWKAAGSNVVIDQPALAIIKRAKIPTFVLNGTRLDQLELALQGRPFLGTTILV